MASERAFPDLSKYRMVHCTALENEHASALISNIKNTETDESYLWVLRDPIRPFWISRIGARSYEDKRLCEYEHNLQQNLCAQHRLVPSIHAALRMRPIRNLKWFHVASSPYLYGADIPVNTIYRKQLLDGCKTPIKSYTVGALDIETSVLGGQEVILISYVDPSGHIYQGILSTFLKDHSPDEIEVAFRNELQKFRTQLNAGAQKHFDKIEWNPHYHVASHEVDIIRWIFNAIHQHKPDFVIVWNMGFDIPYIIDRLKFHRIDPASIMCHPDVPEDLRICEFQPDKKEDLEHFTDRWDWLNMPGYTQFIDAQCLYSRLRKVAGREISYTLQYIASKNLGAGKIDFGESATHAIMQRDRFVDYAVYNIFDSVILKLLDLVNGDILNMMNLIGCSDLREFARQTIRLKNEFYSYCRANKMVTGTVGSSLTRPWDEFITRVGGAVLRPDLAIGTGVQAIEESDIPTSLHKFVMDLDVASMYPSLLMAFNVDRATRIATAVTIDGVENKFFEQVFRGAADPEANAVDIGSRFFGLPNFDEMLALWDQQHIGAK